MGSRPIKVLRGLICQRADCKYLGDDEVAVVERRAADADEDIIVARCWNLSGLIELRLLDRAFQAVVTASYLEVVERSSTDDLPLLLCRWCHFVL